MTAPSDPALVREIRSAVAGALEAAAGASREERLRALEEAIAACLAGIPGDRAGVALDALEETYPVRRTPAEEERDGLRRQLEEERARRTALEERLRAFEEKVRKGDTEGVRKTLEKLAGGKRPVEGSEDLPRLEAVLEALAEHATKTIGYGNVGLDKWNFKEEFFRPFEELVASHIGKPPKEIAEGLRRDLGAVRDILKAMIKADLQFTPKWCESTQARFLPEAFSQGGSKSKAWERFETFMETYRFADDLLQGLRTFIDGERQRAGG